MITRYDSNTLAEQTITVTYAGFTDKFTIKLQDYVNGIVALNRGKLIYERGEEVDISGIEVWKTTAAGRRTEQITDKDSLEIVVPSTKNSGAHAIKVTYTDSKTGKKYTAMTPITVNGTQIYYVDKGLNVPLVEDVTKFAHDVVITWSGDDQGTVNGVKVQKKHTLRQPTGNTESVEYVIVVGEGNERTEKTIIIEIIKPTAKIVRAADGRGYEFIIDNVEDIATAEYYMYYNDTEEEFEGDLKDLSGGELQQTYKLDKNGYYRIMLINKLGVGNVYEFDIDDEDLIEY